MHVMRVCGEPPPVPSSPLLSLVANSQSSGIRQQWQRVCPASLRAPPGTGTACPPTNMHTGVTLSQLSPPPQVDRPLRSGRASRKAGQHCPVLCWRPPPPRTLAVFLFVPVLSGAR